MQYQMMLERERYRRPDIDGVQAAGIDAGLAIGLVEDPRLNIDIRVLEPAGQLSQMPAKEQLRAERAVGEGLGRRAQIPERGLGISEIEPAQDRPLLGKALPARKQVIFEAELDLGVEGRRAEEEIDRLIDRQVAQERVAAPRLVGIVGCGPMRRGILDRRLGQSRAGGQ